MEFWGWFVVVIGVTALIIGIMCIVAGACFWCRRCRYPDPPPVPYTTRDNFGTDAFVPTNVTPPGLIPDPPIHVRCECFKEENRPPEDCSDDGMPWTYLHLYDDNKTKRISARNFKWYVGIEESGFGDKIYIISLYADGKYRLCYYWTKDVIKAREERQQQQ